MKSKTHVIAISLNKDIDNILDRLQQKQNKSRSQIVRDLILNFNKKLTTNISEKIVPEYRNNDSTNGILKKYCKLLSEVGEYPKIFLGIAIATKNHKVVIGLRSGNDPIVKNLTWTFPSTKLDRLNFETQILKNLKTETGLNGKAAKLIFARIIPDTLKKNYVLIAFYYHIRTLSGTLRKGGSFQKVQWVPVSDITKYFTTSTSDEIINFLNSV